MQNPLHALFSGDLKVVAEANCVLARLWRFLLLDLKIRTSSWEGLMFKYCHTYESIVGKSKASNLKGNLPKGLASDEVTFKSFCRGVSVLNFRKVDFSIEIWDGDRRETITVEIPKTFSDDSGIHLKTLWKEMIVLFPERTENWGMYMKSFRERFKHVYGKDCSNLCSSLTYSLDLDDELTWNVFYQGMVVHRFDKVSVKVDITSRVTGEITTVAIDLISN